MPSTSKSQQRLMAAAEHGADFPMANKLRESMSQDQLHDFAVGSMENKPEHVAHHSAPAAYATPLLKGFSNDIVHENVQSLKNAGSTELDATKHAIRMSKGFSNPADKVRKSTHKNLGQFLHPRKDGRPHGSE